MNQSEKDWPPHRAPSQGKLDGVQVGDRAPHLCDQTFLSDINVAEVQRVVDGFHLPHFDKPHTHGFSSSLKDPLPVVLRLVQHL